MILKVLLLKTACIYCVHTHTHTHNTHTHTTHTHNTHTHTLTMLEKIIATTICLDVYLCIKWVWLWHLNYHSTASYTSAYLKQTETLKDSSWTYRTKPTFWGSQNQCPWPFEWLIGIGRLSHGSVEASAAFSHFSPDLGPWKGHTFGPTGGTTKKIEVVVEHRMFMSFATFPGK